MARTLNTQFTSWFWEAYQHGNLDLTPPYQRRSVWNKEYKEYFVDTVLNNLPAPALFLYRNTSSDGTTKYSVVDGKQRLTTLFDFVENKFSIGKPTTNPELFGKYFKDLSDERKKDFWDYLFSVEFLPSTDEQQLQVIFDRINRNTLRLTEQELRHAKYTGEFITEAEKASELMVNSLPPYFPNFNQQSFRQMKDVEFVSEIFLFLENGLNDITQADLDAAYSEKDSDWGKKDEIITRFNNALRFISDVFGDEEGKQLAKTRLKNQADFFALFGAVDAASQKQALLSIPQIRQRLQKFIIAVSDANKRKNINELQRYFESTKAHIDDIGPRSIRIKVLESVISGKMDDIL